ncbi:DUF1835 domain-containing protein [Burkholderia sp. Ac-20344]|uniref:DUF1835 domain-containing protein n=1 Tax=Burkholderia sp. Ac-20344 TaxID=2703890 RepID=UPI00197BA09B|nr:DUF1835 domain-containing protein [Burkholderia sp. Ac-20344]MBN3836263.1 DUF1835 domain-containing protein [Burkholderia sp. Ac-20344]
MNSVHIVPNLSARTILRMALRARRNEDQVITLSDDLTVGPLRDIDASPESRLSFFKSMNTGIDMTEIIRIDIKSVIHIISIASPVIVWHAPCANDQLTLRRVAHLLHQVPHLLHEALLSSGDLVPTHRGTANGQCSVASFGPNVLASKLKDIAPMTVLRVNSLAREWEEFKRFDAPWRRWQHGAIENSHFMGLDVFLVQDMPGDWIPATHVVSKLTSAYFVSDTIAMWRIAEAAATGRIELEGTMCDWGTLKVRASHRVG